MSIQSRLVMQISHWRRPTEVCTLLIPTGGSLGAYEYGLWTQATLKLRGHGWTWSRFLSCVSSYVTWQ